MNTEFDGVFPNEYVAFDMYFASLCSMQVHPGAGTKQNKPMSITQCRDMAIEMLKVRRNLAVLGSPNLKEIAPCRGE